MRRSPSRVRVLALLAALLAATPAAARIKIDRYEAAELPAVRLWVTLLDRTTSIRPDAIQAFTLHVNGNVVPDEIEFQTAAELEQPMAVAAVLDARYHSSWAAIRQATKIIVKDLPDESIAFAVATRDGNTRLPEKEWAIDLDDLPASLNDVEVSGDDPRLYRGVREALTSFPLAPGLVAEPEEKEDLPKPRGEDQPPFPIDRVLYVIGDGAIKVEQGGASAGKRLRTLVYMARRRGVRVMAIGVTEDPTNLWALRVLARKTGGTYRRAPNLNDLDTIVREAAAELSGRFVLDAEAPGLRPGDTASFTVTARLKHGQAETSREFGAAVANVMGWWDRFIDWVSDVWERWPWWARGLLILGVALIVAITSPVITAAR